MREVRVCLCYCIVVVLCVIAATKLEQYRPCKGCWAPILLFGFWIFVIIVPLNIKDNDDNDLPD